MQACIVGAGGYWGPNWVRVLKQTKCLKAICDIDPDRMRQVVERFSLEEDNVSVFDSYDKMLETDLDAVFIVTPPETHANLAISGIQAGKHIFVEKPLATSLEECYRIKFEAERARRCVMVGHTFIYHPAVRKFKESLGMVDKLRTIYTVRANFGQYQSSGVVDDLLPHDLSIFNYLCSAFPDSIDANVSPYQDVAYVTAAYGEVTCSAFLSWGYPDRTRKLVAVGSKGILEWDLSNTHLLFHRKWATPTDTGHHKHFDEGTQNVGVSDQSEPLMAEALHFMECIRDGKEPLTSLDDGINVVKGLEACR